MKIILLEIPAENQKIRKPNSYVNNFLSINYFYFHIPSYLPKTDQDHLEKIAKQFFKLQIYSPIENFVSLKEMSLLKDVKSRIKEISWDIFYKFNQSVTVKSNVFDENLDWDISGFKGKIINFYSGEDEDIYQIQYSAESLNQIPIKKLKQISPIGSPFYTYLEPEYLMPELTQTNTNQDQTELKKLFVNIIDHLEFPPEISTLISESNSFFEIVHQWEIFFKNLSLELQSIEVNFSNQKKYQLIEICESDEFIGVWGKFLKEDTYYLFPLTDIKKVSNHGIFNGYIQFYKQIMNIILPN